MDTSLGTKITIQFKGRLYCTAIIVQVSALVDDRRILFQSSIHFKSVNYSYYLSVFRNKRSAYSYTGEEDPCPCTKITGLDPGHSQEHFAYLIVWCRS